MDLSAFYESVKSVGCGNGEACHGSLGISGVLDSGSGAVNDGYAKVSLRREQLCQGATDGYERERAGSRTCPYKMIKEVAGRIFG